MPVVALSLGIAQCTTAPRSVCLVPACPCSRRLGRWTQYMLKCGASLLMPEHCPLVAGHGPDSLAQSWQDRRQPASSVRTMKAGWGRAGQHTVVCTATASGKSLCYNLPVLEGIAADPGATALYLFPTKALAQARTPPRPCRAQRCACRQGPKSVLHASIAPYEGRCVTSSCAGVWDSQGHVMLCAALHCLLGQVKRDKRTAEPFGPLLPRQLPHKCNLMGECATIQPSSGNRASR